MHFPLPQKTADFRVTALAPPLPLTHHRSMYTMKGQRCVLSRVGLRADIINTSAPRGYVADHSAGRPRACSPFVLPTLASVCYYTPRVICQQLALRTRSYPAKPSPVTAALGLYTLQYIPFCS